MEESFLIAAPAVANQEYPSGSFEHHRIGEDRTEAPPLPPRPRTRAHLAAWQVKLARDMMLA